MGSILLCWKNCESFLKLKSLVVQRGKSVSFLLFYKYCDVIYTSSDFSSPAQSRAFEIPGTGFYVMLSVNIFIFMGISKPGVLEQGTKEVSGLELSVASGARWEEKREVRIR